MISLRFGVLLLGFIALVNSSKVTWLPMTADVKPDQLLPGGWEKLSSGKSQREPTYITRKKLGSEQKVVITRFAKASIGAGDKGDEGIELLSLSDGSLSWQDVWGMEVPFNLPREKLVVAGADPTTTEDVFICRVVQKKELFVGSYTFDKKNCVAQIDGAEKEFQYFEILMKNYFENVQNQENEEKNQNQ